MTCLKRGIMMFAVCASACATVPDAPTERPNEAITAEALEAPAAATNSAAATNLAAEPSASAPGHLLLQVRIDQGSLQLVRVTPMSSPLPKWRGLPREQAWQARALSDTAALLQNIALEDPREIRGESVDPVSGQQRHVSFTQTGPVEFVVRVPANTAKVDFFQSPTSVYAAAVPIGSVTLPKP